MDVRELGRLIQERRRVLGIDQRTAAELGGFSLHTLSDIESGKGNPSLIVLEKVLAVLGLEMKIELRSPPAVGVQVEARDVGRDGRA